MEDGHSFSLVISLIVLVLLSAFFSAAETAFSSANKARLKNLASEGNKRASLAYRLAENYDELLSSILVGNNIVNIASATIATILFVRLLGGKGATVSTIVMTVAILIFGEITPRSMAKENPEAFTVTIAPVMLALNVLLKPVNFLLVKLKGLISGLFHVEASGSLTDDELLTIVDEASQEGGIDSSESELLKNVIEFTDLQAIDIITPRVEVTGVEEGTDKEEIAKVFRETGFSRIPVYRDTIDDIIGIIHQKDFYNKVYGTDAATESIIKPAEFVPPTVKLSQLLKKFQHDKLQFAVVVDDFGGVEGIVTLENILEELVGEIWDEHDEVTTGIRDLGNNRFLITEAMDLDDFLERFGIKEETEASTVNGWVTRHIDKIPEEGDSFVYEDEGQKLVVKVTKTDGQKAVEVIVQQILVNRQKNSQTG